MYLIVFDCSLEIEKVISENKLLYWIDLIDSQTDNNNKILLIGTKLDNLERKYTSFGFLNQKKLNQHLFEINKGKFILFIHPIFVKFFLFFFQRLKVKSKNKISQKSSINSKRIFVKKVISCP